MSDATSRIHFNAAEHSFPDAPPRTLNIYPGVKRSLDVLVVMLAAPFALALIAALVMMIRRDGGRAFFTQTRLGKDGRVFTMWKLRTMVPDAESFLQAYLHDNPAARDEWNRAQKLAVDPRVTPVGRVLRKYSLDELPQLFNVFRGEMSLVGPRPMCPDQRELYARTEYFRMRPGITGLWQVSARNRCSFAERATYDSQYAAMMGLRADLQILWRTATVVFRGTGV